MKKTIFLLTAGLLFASILHSQSAILVNFNAGNGTSNGSTATWNKIQQAQGNIALVDSTNAPTELVITTEFASANRDHGSTTGTYTLMGFAVPGTSQSVEHGIIHDADGLGKITLSSSNPFIVDLEFLASSTRGEYGNGSTSEMYFNIGGTWDAGTTAFSGGQTLTALPRDTGDGDPTDNIVFFDNISSTFDGSSNVLQIQVGHNEAGKRAFVNALAIAVVPEPASWAFLFSVVALAVLVGRTAKSRR